MLLSEGAMWPLVNCFPRLAHKTAHCILVGHLPFPLLYPSTPILLEPTVLLEVLILLLEGVRVPLPAHKRAFGSPVLHRPYPLL